ncbi:metallophosphoesterase [Actinokineospora cianjurensis]|uniref:metallophosphoesterase n=1 Tax=Actinokineospora cianjurensis TaxID=585224 RepID=UPI001FECEFD3|nr:metallophosphoesterase [Actinokineospora cianjurensis]
MAVGVHGGAAAQGRGSAEVVVVGAGDICGSNCKQTADLVKAANPAAVFTTGDNAYENGALSDYRTYYEPAWGQFRSLIKPTPGNHEYQTSGAAGYWDYFNGAGNNNGVAGERGKGYYSWDVGDWHFVALNSNISMSAGSAQEVWLRNDLKATGKPCTAAYFHHPLFTRGSHSPTTTARPIWQALYDNKADLILNGHDHNYQRYAPQRPDGTADATNGIREVLVGTGGRAFYTFSRTMPNIEASNDNTYGILKLTLSATGYRGQFVPVAGRTFTDDFSGACKQKGTTGGFSLSADPATVAPGGSTTTKVTVSGTGSANLSLSGLPSGVTASIQPNPVTAPGAATVTLNATANATPGTTTVTVSGTAGGQTKTTTFALTVGSPSSDVYFDDFERDTGWTVGASDTATTGVWERGDPEATAENGDKQLGTTTSGSNSLVTGRLAGSGAGSYDVDGGRTSMRSPAITLPGGQPRLSFRWSAGLGANASTEDYFRVTVQGATNTIVLEQKGTGAHVNGSWRTASVDLSAFAGQVVRLLVEAADGGSASLVEAQVDDVRVSRG